jgi:outer membrane autotransporter protein
MCIAGRHEASDGNIVRHRVRTLATAIAAVSTLAFGAALMPRPGQAQDATWGSAPATGDWNAVANWIPGTVPTGTATFGASSQTTISFSQSRTTIGTMQFNNGAPIYTFMVQGFAPALEITDKGIVNNSSSAPVFNVSSVLNFRNFSTAGNAVVNNGSGGGVAFRDSSSAGSAAINNDGFMGFGDSSSAGNAKITNTNGIGFTASSTAGNATIRNNLGGVTKFRDSSTAGNATMINDGHNRDFENSRIVFLGSSTAANATITNNAGTFLEFRNNSTAGNATITNNGGVIRIIDSNLGSATITNTGGETIFGDGLGATTTGSAGNATIINNAGGKTTFVQNTTGGNARFITDAGGEFDMSGLSSAGMAAGSIEGAGSYFLGGKTLTVGSNNRSTEVSGVIADGGFGGGGVGGGLVKVGTGTLTLSGVNTYTGPTAINGGTLAVNGAIAKSATTVNTGGTLAGIGTVGDTRNTSGGTVAPGNASIGTLNVAGRVSFAPGSFYAADIDAAGHSDKIAATGAATLGGGTVQVKPVNGIAVNTRYTILTAAAGVTGAFAGVTGPSSTFTTPKLSYDPNDVFLTFARNDVSFASVGLTRNQIATGAAADSLGHGPVFNVVAGGTAAQARQAFDQLSGEVHASAAGVMLDESRYLRDAVTGRLRQPYGYGAGPFAAFAAADSQITYANEASPGGAPVLGYAGAPVVTKAAPMLSPERAIAAWAQAVGAWGRTDGDHNAAALRRSTGGFVTGVDTTFDERWRVGVAGGYTRSSLHVDDRRSSGTIDNFHLALYGGGQFGAVGLRGGAAFTWHDVDVSRGIAFPGFADTAKASSHARSAQVFGEVGHSLTVSALALEPFAGLAYVHLNADRFAETDGAAALTGAAETLGVTYTTLGARAGTAFALADGTLLNLRGTLGWQHTFGDVTPQALLAFRDGGTPFSIAGVPIARDALLAEAGLGVDLTRNASLGVSYSGQVARGAHDHAAKGSFSWRF